MIRYRKLGHVELNVTDIGASRRFYESVVGLQYVESGPDGELFFRCDRDRYNIVLHPAAEPGLHRVGWMLEDEHQFAPLHAALSAARVAHRELGVAECRARHLARATRATG